MKKGIISYSPNYSLIKFSQKYVTECRRKLGRETTKTEKGAGNRIEQDAIGKPEQD